ncbi:MAG: alpha/beta hydrolase [Dehalococcoidia bacterium]
MSVSTQLGEQKQVALPAGTISYRERGGGSALVFVHGLLVNGDLWRKVVPELAKDYRCITPDWPLGSHATPMNPDSDLSPHGIAQLIADFLAALELSDVTLVGNDSGGALSQMVVTRHPDRVGRLVLTSCDGFEVFPPTMFKYLGIAARIPGAIFELAQSMRIRALRRLPFAYGALWNQMPESAVMDSYARPMISSGAVRRDLKKFLKGMSPRYTIEAGRKLGSFNRPVLLAWDDEDRFFKWELAKRIAGAFPDARLERVADSRTFVPEDQPDRLTELIRDFIRDPAAREVPA